MSKKIIPFIFIGVVVLTSLFYFTYFNKNNHIGSNVRCYEYTMESLNRNNNFSLFKLENITHLRCEGRMAFDQYEISGTDNSGHSFYIHSYTGGMAASGGDMISDYCYKKDGVIDTEKSKKLYGREGTLSEPTCTYIEGLQVEPEGNRYEFNK